jgi:hypothetical protein
MALMIRWFDHYLKGKDNGADRDPTVRYYVMGAVGEENAPGNQWQTAADWPIASHSIPYYLHAEGKLTTVKPTDAKATSTLLADPIRPVEIAGRSFPGARDARTVEKQDNVLTFTTDVLDSPVEWTGKVQAEMFLSSSARDTDLIVRVSDVYPDGRSILIVDYIRRVRYREGYKKEVFMEPGKVYPVRFDVGSLSQIFNKGHRIRVTVASTGAPFFEPNPNTGKPLTIEFPDDAVAAKNTIHHNSRYASHIVAPVAGD